MLIESDRAEAVRIRQEYSSEVAVIKAATGLSRQGKDQLIAQEYVKARDALKALREQSDRRHAYQQAQAHYRAFGLAPEISTEDRAERDRLAASPPTPAQAAEEMRIATARGDVVRQRALAEYAWINRNHVQYGRQLIDGVLQPYGALSLKHDQAIMDLISFDNATPQDQLSDNLFTDLPQPDVFGNVDHLARQADADDGSDLAGDAA